MNSNELKAHLLTACVVFVAAFVAVFAGERLMPARSTEPPVFGGEVSAQSIQPGLTYRNLTVRDYFINNGTETLNGGVTASAPITAAAGLTVTAGSLGIGADAFSGPVRYARFTSVANNGLITYSLSTTPTVVMCWAGSIYTPSVILASLTPVTATIATSTTVPVLYCMAGR